MELPAVKQEKAKLTEINETLSCYLCKGYLIDATTISECLHSFCRSCIVRFLFIEDNSYCPKCEVIINKAKPNLKLDKILQDVVYKLVPELFHQEMARRKQFYSAHHPNVLARIAPEDRGEDTERTIFSSQEQISLSLEYISEDDPPSDIHPIQKILNKMSRKYENKNTNENDTSTTTDSDDQKVGGNNQESQMKTFLLCPGMSPIEVLKKFLRNKYNVDTNQFYIDILYKRVPLPDHYTLIDIAYIYSWQRNELMKFYFSIIDRKASKSSDNNHPLTPYNFMQMCSTRPMANRNHNNNGNKVIVSNDSHKKKETIVSTTKKKSLGKSYCKSNKQIIEEQRKMLMEDNNKDDESMMIMMKKSEKVEQQQQQEKEDKSKLYDFEIDDEKIEERKIKKEKNNFENLYENKHQHLIIDSSKCKQFIKVPKTTSDCLINNSNNNKKMDRPSNLYVDRIFVNNDDDDHPVKQQQKESVLTTKMENNIKCESLSPTSANISGVSSSISQFKIEPISPTDILPSNNTNTTTSERSISITLKRSENVEIITQIEPISNENGLQIGHHIIKRTIKKGHSNNHVQPNNNNTNKPKNGGIVKKSPTNNTKKHSSKQANTSSSSLDEFEVKRRKKSPVKKPLPPPQNTAPLTIDDEKSRFFNSIELRAVDNSTITNIKSPIKKSIVQKRKSPTALKSNKPPVKKSRTLLKQKSPSATIVCPQQQKTNLQSIISSCNLNIPSSLSITIKNSSDSQTSTPVARPVKNFIEILKLPDDNSTPEKEKVNTSSCNSSSSSSGSVGSFDLGNDSTSRLCLSKLNEDSEQKVDQELSEIARSLTEKIPMSTTISPIIDGAAGSGAAKAQSQTQAQAAGQLPPVQVPTSSALHVTLLPELGDNTKSTESSKSDVNSDKSSQPSQSFQKIFEESIKKTQDTSTESSSATTTLAVQVPATDTVAVEQHTDLKKQTNSESDQSKTVETPKPSKSKKQQHEQVPLSVDGGKKRMKLYDAKQKRLDLMKKKFEMKKSEFLLPKVPIPRLNSGTKQQQQQQQHGNLHQKEFSQTTANLHSPSLGMNYTVSVSQQVNPTKFHNGSITTATLSDGGAINVVEHRHKQAPPPLPPPTPTPPVSPLNEIKPIQTEFKVPSPSLGSPKLPEVSTGRAAAAAAAVVVVGDSSTNTTVKSSPKRKTSPKSSPVVKHMFAHSNEKLPSPRMMTISPKTTKSSSAKTSPTNTNSTCRPRSSKSAPSLLAPSNDITTPSSRPEMFQFLQSNISHLTNALSSNPFTTLQFQQAYMLKQFQQQQQQQQQQQLQLANQPIDINSWFSGGAPNRLPNPFLAYDKCINFNGPLNNGRS